MKLLLRRSERPSSVLGKPIYILDVRAEFTPIELQQIAKFKFGRQFLYSRKGKPDVDTTKASGIAALFLHLATDITVSVNDLVQGKRIELKDITELMAAEAQIRDAAQQFGAMLRGASGFGGEEVIDL